MRREITIRNARPDESSAVADIIIRARQAAMPQVAATKSAAEMYRWVEEDVFARKRVLVASDEDSVLGFAALYQGWLDHLYVDPAAQGRGVGRALLEAVKTISDQGFRLMVFQANWRARAFYSTNGLVELALGDGAGNEENEPEAIYGWSPVGLNRRR
jgi:ribosomal protein S18 acetylase RimI-like enzyme